MQNRDVETSSVTKGVVRVVPVFLCVVLVSALATTAQEAVRASQSKPGRRPNTSSDGGFGEKSQDMGPAYVELSARENVQFACRHAKVASALIPGGETLNDGFGRIDWWLRDDLQVRALLQYKKWLAPLLAPTPQTNWTSAVELTFWPRAWSR